MIEVMHLTKQYGDRKAIDNLNFSVQPGEVVGFLGPNGAGKTTTMKIITGFMPATEGQVTIEGKDVFEFPKAAKEKIGYLPEVPPVYLDMSVSAYLKYVAQLKKVDSAQIENFVNIAMEKTQLHDVARREIGHLSKGFRQRVGIAGAIVSNPPILVLDEPTVGLDPAQVAEIRKLILSLKGQHTVLISTHILSEVQATCERLIIINQGKIVAQGALSDFTQKASEAGCFHVKVLRQEKPLEEHLKKMDGVTQLRRQGHAIFVETISDRLSAEDLAKSIVDFGAGLTHFELQRKTLEDIFIELTTKSNSSDEEVVV